MEQGKTGAFDLSGTKGMTGRIHWSEQFDAAANTHTVEVTAFEIRAGTYFGAMYFLGSHDNYGTIRIDGTDTAVFRNLAGSHYVTPGRYAFAPVRTAEGYSAPPWKSRLIPGGEDGNCQVTVRVDTWGFGSGDGNGFHITGSQQLELTRLPRASQIHAENGEIGSVCPVSILCTLPHAEHSLAYRFGELTGYVNQDGSVTDQPVKSRDFHGFRIPENFYSQIPNSTSGTCYLTCTTWQNGTTVGQPQTASFPITAPIEKCGPAVSGTVTDSNPVTAALTGDPGILVRYLSRARCRIRAEARHWASLTEQSVDGQPVSGQELVLEHPEKGSFRFAASDTRGYRTEQMVTVPLVPYVLLTCHPQVRRTDPASGRALLTVSGTCYGGSFGASSNYLMISYQTDTMDEPAKLTPRIFGSQYNLEIPITGQDYRQTHTVAVTASDALSTVRSSCTLHKGIPLFDWGHEDFTFHIPVDFQGGILGIYRDKNHPDCFFRIRDGEKEWLQPPMELGTVYRTTARMAGNPVYTRADWALVVPGGTAAIPNPGCSRVLRFSGYVGPGSPLPLLSGSSDRWVTVDAAPGGEIQVHAGSSVPEWGFLLQIWFTVDSSFQPDRSSAMLGLGALEQMRLGEW